VDLASSDLDHATDRYGLVTPEIQDSFQDQVGVQARGSERRRIAGLERQRKENSGVKRSVVIGVPWQDEAMGEGLGIIRVQFGHAR
jgi:hypothetical protein